VNKFYRMVDNLAADKRMVGSGLIDGGKRVGHRAKPLAIAVIMAMGSLVGEAAAAERCNDADGERSSANASRTCADDIPSSPETRADVGISGGNFSSGNGISISYGATAANAAANGDIAIGAGSSANSGANGNGYYSLAIGNAAKADATSAVAVGASANASTGAAALGWRATAMADNAIAIGMSSSARAADSIAIGHGAVAVSQNSIVLGVGASDVVGGDPVTGGVAIGAGATLNSNIGSNAQGTVAIGQSASGFGNYSVAIGGGAASHNTHGTAVGGNAVSTSGGTALGYNANSGASGAMALGVNSSAQGANTVAVGVSSSIASGVSNAVALGTSSTATRSFTVSVGNGSTNRQIVNMAAGTRSTDAINLSQLSPLVAALGGNASVDPNTGTVTGPAYLFDHSGEQVTVEGVLGGFDNTLTQLDEKTMINEGNISGLRQQIVSGTIGLVQQANMTADVTVAAGSGGTLVNVAGIEGDRRLSGLADGIQDNDAINVNQLRNIENQLGDVNAGSVHYDNADKSAITLGGIDASNLVALHNVADGELSDTSHDAVSGSQLYATHQQVEKNADSIIALDGRVTVNEGNIDNLLSGKAGLVRQADTSAVITVAAGSGGALLSVSGTDGDRRITGVADGTQDNDAANVGQLKALQDLVGSSDAVMVTYDDIRKTSVTLGGAGASAPVALHNVADGQSTYDAANFGQLTLLQNTLQNQISGVSTQVGLLGDRVSTLESLHVGIDAPYLDGHGADSQKAPANAGDTPGVALGYNSLATGDNAAAVGQNAQALGDHGTAIGGNAYAGGFKGTAIGDNAQVSADGSVAVGASATVASNATNAVAVGADSAVNAASGTALGQGATVSAAATNSVALGAGSQATQANTVSVGSVGNERTVTNVAPGVNGTDAVNMSQLQAAQDWAQNYTDGQTSALNSHIERVGRRANAGTASAIAMANIPQAYAPDQGSIGAGVGTFRGQTAVAVGMSTITPNGRWVLKANISGSTQGEAGVGLGAAMVW
jgi:trimeric autotransporter adhesin